MLSAAVVGAGLMGRRIAGVLARGGLRVALTDTRTEILESACTEAESVAGGAGAIHPVSELADAVSTVDIVVEAVVEDLAVKRALFAELAELAPATAILATNTSVLPVTAIAADVADAGRCVGTHWWNPPDLIPIVEVVLGERTDPAAADRTSALLARLGKTPVLVRRDVPGFVGNRLQHALWREAIALVAEGVADPSTVDLVVRNTIGLRLAAMGPIENADYVGLDLTLAIHQAVLPALDRSTAPNPLLRSHIEAGELGAKSGRGFLDWPPGAREAAAARLADHVARQL